MHSGNFTQVRDFVLEHAQSVVQDDFGIPLAAFKPDTWNFFPFGNYLGPIAIFPGRNQPRLGELFKRQAKAPKLDFGIGYRHRSNEFQSAARGTQGADEAPAGAGRPAPADDPGSGDRRQRARPGDQGRVEAYERVALHVAPAPPEPCILSPLTMPR